MEKLIGKDAPRDITDHSEQKQEIGTRVDLVKNVCEAPVIE